MLNELEDRSVVFSPEEVRRCVSIGREITRSSKGFRNHRVSTESDEFIQIIGVLGEYAVCRYLGIDYSSTINSFRRADLPCNIEVKAHMEPGYCLRIRPDDANDRKMVMAIVTGIGRPVILPGWIAADEGKKIGRVIDPRCAGKPMYIVPQESLWPMIALRIIVHGEKSSCIPAKPAV